MHNKNISFQELTQQALDNYQQAQKEFAQAWADYMATTMGSIDWLTPSKTAIVKTVKALQINFEESLRPFETKSGAGVNLFKQAIGAPNGHHSPDAPQEFQRLLERSLAAFRSGTQSMIALNTKAVQWWVQLLAVGSRLHLNGQNGKQ